MEYGGSVRRVGSGAMGVWFRSGRPALSMAPSPPVRAYLVVVAPAHVADGRAPGDCSCGVVVVWM